jgi:NADH:quinone reductase (non-electrogenic)
MAIEENREASQAQSASRPRVVIVGGGPTGVELAGAIAEMIRHVMRKDFPTVDFRQVRVCAGRDGRPRLDAVCAGALK